MIVWLSGWPQSGSTLIRMLIQDTMKSYTYSCYPEKDLVFLFGEGTVLFRNDWCLEKYLEYRDDKNLWLIKTHDVPTDGLMAIHYVRDGRNACSSLSRFWDCEPSSVILGEKSDFTDWSTHYRATDPRNRPNTLFLRFEDMINDPDGQAGKISEFTGLKIHKKFENTKEECIKRWPQLFKPKPGNWKEDLSEKELELFWKVHGPVMEELGYE